MLAANCHATIATIHGRADILVLQDTKQNITKPPLPHHPTRAAAEKKKNTCTYIHAPQHNHNHQYNKKRNKKSNN